jgi:BirA family transcriptional regulator, biotin operon repressor / biotin---[acetyl-CoA-carboxylase] ligase
MPDEPATSFEVRWFASIDSTNRYLLDEGRRGAPEGLVAVADHQTQGRGRRGRSWIAPPGASLLVSVLLRPGLPPERLQLVSIVSGIAMARAVERVAGFLPALKWPNDLVTGNRKLAGLRAESDGDAVVVGIGVNVEWHDFPPELSDIATACNIEAGRSVDRRDLLSAFLAELDPRYRQLDLALDEYRTLLATVGRRVRVERADGDLVGRAVDVGAAGELVLDVDGHGLVSVHAGDVVHLRDANP